MFSKSSKYFNSIASEINKTVDMYHDVFSLSKNRIVKVDGHNIEKRINKYIKLSFPNDVDDLGRKSLFERLCAFSQWHEETYSLIIKLVVNDVLKESGIVDNKLTISINAKLIADFYINGRGIRSTLSKPSYSSLPTEELAKGVFYSSSTSDMFSHAIKLNFNSLKSSGSIWATLSAEPSDIGNMISKHISSANIVHINDESMPIYRLDLNTIPQDQIKELFIQSIDEDNNIFHYSVVKLISMYWVKIYDCIHKGSLDSEFSLPYIIDYANKEKPELIDFIQEFSRTYTNQSLDSFNEEDIHDSLYEQWGYMAMQVNYLTRKAIDCWVTDGLNLSDKEDTHYIFKSPRYHDFILLAIKYHKMLDENKPNIELKSLGRSVFVERYSDSDINAGLGLVLSMVARITNSPINQFFYGSSIRPRLSDYKGGLEICSVYANTRHRVVFWDDINSINECRLSGVADIKSLQLIGNNTLAVSRN